MAEEGVHPGSWLGDAVEEFKKAPTPAKIGIVVAFVAVAGIGFYEYNKSKGSSSGVSGASSPSTDLQAGNNGGAQQFSTVPGGNTGTVPVLPAGLQPLFDAAGNLIGFEPSSTPTTTTPAPGGGTTKSGGGTKKKKSGSSDKGKSGGSSHKGGSHTTTHDKGGDTSSSGHSVKSKSHNPTPTVQHHSGKEPTSKPIRRVNPPARTAPAASHSSGGSSRGGGTASTLRGIDFAHPQSFNGTIFGL